MKIALVQFYQYHEEVLAPQIDFLLLEHELFVAAPQEVFNNDYILAFETSITKVVFSNKKYNSKSILTVPFIILSIIIKYVHLFFIVKRNNIKIIIYNTINKRFHFFLIKILFRKTKNIHIIYNAQMFTTTKTIKSLSLFDKNLFLSLKSVRLFYKYAYKKHRQNNI
jgi:hypothetical protein